MRIFYFMGLAEPFRNPNSKIRNRLPASPLSRFPLSSFRFSNSCRRQAKRTMQDPPSLECDMRIFYFMGLDPFASIFTPYTVTYVPGQFVTRVPGPDPLDNHKFILWRRYSTEGPS